MYFFIIRVEGEVEDKDGAVESEKEFLLSYGYVRLRKDFIFNINNNEVQARS